jgi:hypothetical protein
VVTPPAQVEEKPPTVEEPAATASEDPVKEEAAKTEDSPEAATDDGDAAQEKARQTLVEFYTERNPEKLNMIEGWLQKYKGREETLVTTIIDKYNKDNPESAPASKKRKIEEVAEEQTPEEIQESTRMRLTLFYQDTNPEKIPMIAGWMEKYRGRESELVDKIFGKYVAEAAAKKAEGGDAGEAGEATAEGAAAGAAGGDGAEDGASYGRGCRRTALREGGLAADPEDISGKTAEEIREAKRAKVRGSALERMRQEKEERERKAASPRVDPNSVEAVKADPVRKKGLKALKMIGDAGVILGVENAIFAASGMDSKGAYKANITNVHQFLTHAEEGQKRIADLRSGLLKPKKLVRQTCPT